MPAKNTGDEILAYCGSCKMDLTAVIVATVGSKIAKVLCKTCKKERAYRPPKGVQDPAASPPPSRASKARAAEKEPRSVPVQEEWSRLMADAEKARKVKYTPKAQLQLGDVIDHPMFGPGIVTKLTHPDKADVLFKEDLKILIHSRA